MRPNHLAIPVICVLILSLFTIGCEEEEDVTIAKAQECYNNATNGTQAQACLDMLAGANTAEANALKCGIAFFVAGLTDTAMIQAFEDFDNAASSAKESELLEALVLSSTASADTAYNYCAASGSAGLLYIGTLARTATYLEAAAGGAAADANTLVDDCNGNTSCEATVGEMLVSMVDEYCIGDSADGDVCQAAITAVNAGGGNYQLIGDQFLDQIDPIP